MNRIILIGNGFDLAHGRRTSYQQFLADFWNRKRIAMLSRLDENLVCRYSDPFRNIDHPHNHLKLELDNHNSDINVGSFRECLERTTISGYDWIKQVEKCYSAKSNEINSYKSIAFTRKNDFLHKISRESLQDYWSGIEVQYYKELKKYVDDAERGKEIETFHREFLCIKKELEIYLGTLDNATMIPTIREKIYSGINHRDFPGEKPSDTDLETVMFLNFNYTRTAELYIKDENELKNVIYIHGKLNDNRNPIIFGYGDESDEAYQRIMKLHDNRYLENIKSANYSQTENYNRILDFIKSNKYQIFVMGHSCGISDTDILSKLFSDENCLSIKVFYHEKSKDEDDFKDISDNISRYFKNIDSRMKKLVNKQHSELLQ